LQNLKNNSEREINALDLIGNPVSAIELLKAEELLKMNYGVDYPKEKFSMLWEMIKEEGWTDIRLKETLKWFLKRKKFPNWTVADWFEYGTKLFNNAEYLKQLNEIGKSLNEQIEWYIINGVYLWKYKDGIELPFEKAVFKKQN
jgi:hypothetical protein